MDLDGFAGPDQAPRRTVARLLDIAPGCVVAEVDLAHPEGTDRPDPPAGSGVVVELREDEVDSTVNPTGWVIAREEFVADVEATRGCG